MRNYQVRLSSGAIFHFDTKEEALLVAQRWWSTLQKISYTDDSGDRIIMYPLPTIGQFEIENMTETVQNLVKKYTNPEA